MIIKKLIVGLMTAIALAGAGCAGTNFLADPATHDLTLASAKIAIQYGTMKFIDEDPARAQRVLVFIDHALAVVNADETASMDTMTIKIQALIPFDTLDPAERVLVANLVEVVVAELKARVHVPENAPIAEVRQVLEWVKQAAQLSLPS